MSKFYENFKSLCKSKGLSMSRVVNELGGSTGLAANWKDRSDPSTEWLLKISNYLDVSTDFLLKGDSARSMLGGEDEKITVRVYDESASAGFGNYLSEDSSYEEIEFSVKTVPARTDFGIRINGNSMEPQIEDGSIVFVEAAPAIDSGEIGIFVVDGSAYCKKLLINYDKRKAYLISLNTDYLPIDITEETEIRTIGKVLDWAKE